MFQYQPQLPGMVTDYPALPFTQEPWPVMSGKTGELEWELFRQYDRRGRNWFFVTISHVDGFDAPDQVEYLESWVEWIVSETRDGRVAPIPEQDWNERHGTYYVDLIGNHETILHVLSELQNG